MHEQSKLEQILARQRQKLDQVDKRKKTNGKKQNLFHFLVECNVFNCEY